jgi:hypothetical protein
VREAADRAEAVRLLVPFDSVNWHQQSSVEGTLRRHADRLGRRSQEKAARFDGLGENEGKVQRAGQFLPLRQFVDLQRDREIFLTQIGRLGLELMLQLAQVRLVGISGFR